MKIYRYENNPIITPHDVKPYNEGFEVIGAFNGGVTKYNNEIIMLLRVAERPISNDKNIVKIPIFNVNTNKIDIKIIDKNDPKYVFSDPRVVSVREEKNNDWRYLTSISYIRIARSKDGKHFKIDDKPFIYPSNELQIYGLEDPRVTKIDDVYYIYFSAISPAGVGVMMVKTKDFKKVYDCGMIFSPENKDVIIFPEKINNKYYAINRPTPKSTGNLDMWLAESDNLIHWGNFKHILGIRENMWDNERIGGGAVPIKTEKGWLELYHGASKEQRYCIGALLLDLDDPSKVIARCSEPILEPEAPYEVEGFFKNVVFTCGALVDDDIIKLYYGVADTSMAYAELSINDILNTILKE